AAGERDGADAFRPAPPRAWVNFRSLIGLPGQAGGTGYASGNDFLNTKGAYPRAAVGREEFPIGLTLWRSVGLGANPVTRAFLEKSRLFTSMRTNEGSHHFLREINLSDRAASSVHLGSAELRSMEWLPPTFFDAQVAAHTSASAHAPHPRHEHSGPRPATPLPPPRQRAA
ncbi:hypothetical protein, partial [Burkholderia thailandensis]|uniref:hypothetical protein n=1 Tax=Burkholderia thailandensis TaxID=57975 RepID=UPI00217D21A4